MKDYQFLFIAGLLVFVISNTAPNAYLSAAFAIMSIFIIFIAISKLLKDE